MRIALIGQAALGEAVFKHLARPTRDEGRRLTADVTPPETDPPNMVCDNCGHTWWVPDAGR